MKRTVGFAVVVALGLWPLPARAGPIFQIRDDSGAGNPEENLLFNKTGLVTAGPTVQGATNQSLSVLDIVSGDGTILDASPGKGQAMVEKQGGGTFGEVAFAPHRADDLAAAALQTLDSFLDIEFSLDFDFDADLPASLRIAVEGVNGHGDRVDGTASFSANNSGQQKFRVTAANDSVITKVTLTPVEDAAPNDALAILRSIKQIRLTPGATIPPPPGDGDDGRGARRMPEPTSLAVWSLLALLSASYGCFARRRRRE